MKVKVTLRSGRAHIVEIAAGQELGQILEGMRTASWLTFHPTNSDSKLLVLHIKEIESIEEVE